MRKSHFIILLLAAFCMVATICAGEIVLADGGKTLYRVCGTKKKMRQAEYAAIRDLCNTLKEITGADFKSAKGKTRRILVGTPAPSDKRPLKKGERRIVSENGDIYIWGEDKNGNVNAVYDFLKDALGCRWFTISGDKRIPKQSRPVFKEKLDMSLVPSIYPMTAVVHVKFPAVNNFIRRNSIRDRNDSSSIGPVSHPARRIIPCGLIPYGGREGHMRGPWKLFKDKAYFKTNPEFFALDKNGKRTRKLQLCYSNPELRKEYHRNIMLMIKDAKYDGSDVTIGLGHDDYGGKFCYCKGCVELEKKYDHPAGPYFDFIIETANHFGKIYPNITFDFSAYRAEQTLYPPDPAKFKGFPKNVRPGIAPLEQDFAKPLTHPVNSKYRPIFEGWGKVSSQLRWSSYPSIYLRPRLFFQPVANFHRMMVNIDFAYRNKATTSYCEFGYSIYDTFGFNDMLVYAMSEKFRRVSTTEETIIREFTDTCYGKAAPGVRKFLADMEEKEKTIKTKMRWNPQYLFVDYTTFDNLLRWTKDFDAMEELVADNRRHFVNLRRCRFVVDQCIIARWLDFTDAERQQFGDLEKIIARCEQTMLDHCSTLYATMPQTARERTSKRIIKWYKTGFDQIVCVARGGRELPDFLKKHKKVYRLLPNRNKSGLNVDPESAFGLASVNPYSTYQGSLMLYHYYDHAKESGLLTYPLPKPINLKRVEKVAVDGKYHWYHLGAVPMLEDCQLMIHRISPQSNFAMCHIFDPENPDRLYDLYVSLAADKKANIMKVDQLVVVPGDATVAKGKPQQTVKSDDSVDLFI